MHSTAARSSAEFKDARLKLPEIPMILVMIGFLSAEGMFLRIAPTCRWNPAGARYMLLPLNMRIQEA
jgi:hypothetical protein